MKTIICTVGTSTIEKMKMEYLPWDLDQPNAELYISELRQQDFNDAATVKYRDGRGKDILVNKYLSEIEAKYESLRDGRHYSEWEDHDVIWRLMPAEISSTIRLIQKLRLEHTQIKVELLTSDTGEAWLASKVICAIFGNIDIQSNERLIEGYQMENTSALREIGIQNFVQVIDLIITNQTKVNDEYSNEKNVFFNITGGYKNFIPLVTHISSFYQQDMYYVFEEIVARSANESIVSIPTIPTFNSLLVNNNEELVKILNEVPEWINTDEKDFMRELSTDLEDIFQSDPEETEDYINFCLGFFEVNGAEVKHTILGKVYLELLNKSWRKDEQRI